MKRFRTYLWFSKMLHIHKPYGAAAVGTQQTVAVYMWRRGPVCVCAMEVS